MNFLNFERGSQKEFEAIATKLFNKWKIVNNQSEFRLTEIEFYWNSKDHEDNSVYKRTHANPNNGEWYFHYSGVDIALRDDSKQGHGGILIRGIYDINEKKKYKGPLVCMMKLFSGCNAFGENAFAKLVPFDFNDSLKITAKPRHNIGKNGKANGADKWLYAFHINI